ncbi:unnamed protein product, partial [Ectocarpus sp. 6 AP-2014]
NHRGLLFQHAGSGERTWSVPAIIQRVRREGAGHQRLPDPGSDNGGALTRKRQGTGDAQGYPAGETKAGVLCIEMRLRLHTDGAMSKLLENLAKDTDNPTVRLQGPFVIQKLVPPPAHRNVIMIAAGTGI